MPPPILENLDSLKSPPDFEAVFGFAGPLELEIGSGKGGFAAAFGAKYPRRRLVTVEMRRTYAEMTRERVRKAGLENVLVLHGDARSLVPRLFPASSLDAAHVYFPDPWWKRRHFKRRLIDPPFARLLFTALKPEAWLHVRTDVAERALDMLSVLTQAGFENPAGPGGFAPYDPEEVPTTRERRYLTSGEPVWRIRLIRGPGAPDRAP
jgi:tRNA (guanine-N7-)-methyltransferase